MSNEMPTSFSEMHRFLLGSSGPVVALLLIFGGVVLKSYLGWQLIDLFIFSLMIILRSFVEWFFHKYVWHAKPLVVFGLCVKNPVAIMHSNHHKHPYDLSGLLFGGKGVVSVFLIIMAISFPVFEGVSIGLDFSISFMIILLVHEWFHLLCHSNISPKSRVLSRIINNHRFHHYENQRTCFGVSSLLADNFFKTTPVTKVL